MPLDEELMMRVKMEGDEEAFELLVQRHRRPILNFAYRFMGDREIAEDISQDVFLRLWASSSTYLPVAKFTTFLYTIAKNLCLNAMAKSKNAPAMQSLDDPDASGSESVTSLQDGSITSGNSPDQEVVGKEIVGKIEEAVGKLSPEHRLVFILTEYHGYSYQEVAAIAQCPIGTVASRKNTAVKQLRQRLMPLSE